MGYYAEIADILQGLRITNRYELYEYGEKGRKDNRTFEVWGLKFEVFVIVKENCVTARVDSDITEVVRGIDGGSSVIAEVDSGIAEDSSDIAIVNCGIGKVVSGIGRVNSDIAEVDSGIAEDNSDIAIVNSGIAGVVRGIAGVSF